MSNTRRSGFRWTVNEILSLQREYELLELPISEIAVRHGRSFFSILSKLKSEGFIDAQTYNSEVMKNRHNVDQTFDVDFVDNSCANDNYSYSNSEMTIMDERISFLESAVNDIRCAVSKLLTNVYGNGSGFSCNTY